MDKQRSDEKLDQFLDYLTDSVPEAEVPPFFATRVAARMKKELPPLTWALQRMAARMVPVFGVLLVALTILIYHAAPGGPENPSELFFVEEPGSEEEITIDDVLSLLAEIPGEETEFD